MRDFDKKTLKLSNYIYKHQGVTEGELYDIFTMDISMQLIVMCKQGYLVAQSEDGTYLTFEKTPWSTTTKTKYFTTPKLNVVVEDNHKFKIAEIRNWLTTVIAVASFIKAFFL